MNERQIKVQNFLRNPKVWLSGAALIIFIAIAAFVISRISSQSTESVGEELAIDNLAEYLPEFPEENKSALFRLLYNRVSVETPEGAQIPNSGAVIRDGTFEQDFSENNNIYAGVFIVDIADLEQSYRINFQWSPDPDAVFIDDYRFLISCVTKSARIYESFQCDAKNNSMYNPDPETQLSNNSPAYFELEDGTRMAVYDQRYQSGEVFAEASVDACGDTEKISAAQAKAEEWLEEIGIDLEDMPVSVRDVCWAE